MTHRPISRSRRRDLRVLWSAQFVNTAALMMLVPVMPFYVERLGVSEPGAVALWAGAALAAPALMLTITTPLWGWVGDRVGRKWMVVRALVGLAASMGVIAAAQGPLALVAGRLLQGTLGGVVEAATAFVAGESEDADRGRALGRSFSATAAGAVAGPALGGVLIAGDAIRLLMIGTSVVALLAAIGCAVWLTGRDGGPEKASGSRLRDSIADALGAPGARALFAAAFAAHLALYGLVPVFALHVRSMLDEPSAAGAWVGGLHAVTWGASAAGAVWWGRRNDRAPRAASSLALAAAGCALSLLLQALPIAPALLLPLRLLQGFCFAAVAQSVLLEATRTAPPQQRGAHAGVANSFLLAGQVAGPLAAGALLAVLSSAATIVLLGLTSLAAAALAGSVAAAERTRDHRATVSYAR